jgi:23S rRNA pseudouridine1911/1915/1917 synthase
LLESRTASEPARLLIVDGLREHRRLDQFVAAALAPEWSRSYIGRLIKAGLIKVNGTEARASYAIRPGDQVEIASLVLGQPAQASRSGTSSAAALAGLEVLFSDEELVVVSKPAGLPVHPSPGHPHSTLADELLGRFPEMAAMVEPDGLMRAGIVHRLDKETSGVMLVARTPFARMALSQQFKDRNVSKVYLAIVRGIVPHDRFIADSPIGRHPTQRKRMSTRSHKPRTAHTQFLVLCRFRAHENPMTLLKARPQSGRTHQIRVHLAAAGHPCLGDTLYGGKSSAGWARKGQALHALALTITHPRTGKRQEFIAPPPNDFYEFLIAGGLQIGPSVIRRWIDEE